MTLQKAVLARLGLPLRTSKLPETLERVWDLRFRVWGLGFRIWGLGFSLGFRVHLKAWAYAPDLPAGSANFSTCPSTPGLQQHKTFLKEFRRVLFQGSTRDLYKAL